MTTRSRLYSRTAAKLARLAEQVSIENMVETCAKAAPLRAIAEVLDAAFYFEPFDCASLRAVEEQLGRDLVD